MPSHLDKYGIVRIYFYINLYIYIYVRVIFFGRNKYTELTVLTWFVNMKAAWRMKWMYIPKDDLNSLHIRRHNPLRCIAGHQANQLLVTFLSTRIDHEETNNWFSRLTDHAVKTVFWQHLQLLFYTFWRKPFQAEPFLWFQFRIFLISPYAWATSRCTRFSSKVVVERMVAYQQFVAYHSLDNASFVSLGMRPGKSWCTSPHLGCRIRTLGSWQGASLDVRKIHPIPKKGISLNQCWIVC